MRTETLITNFELVVLLALIRLGDDAYGIPISSEIELRCGREPSMASIYAALARLEGKGFVSSRMGEPTPERGGRAKRYFRISPRGLREVREVKGDLIKMWSGITDLKEERA